MKKPKGLVTILISIIGSSQLVACGNMTHPNQVQAPNSSVNVPAVTSSSSQSDPTKDYTCPGTPNIKPSRSYDTNLSTADTAIGVYTVCKSSIAGDYNRILIHGKTANSQSVCVFPVNQNSTGNPTPVLDKTGALVSQCGSITSNGVFIDLGTLPLGGFNGAVIVEGMYRESMRICLKGGVDPSNYTYYAPYMHPYCPPYSVGTFR